jgi:hypothetical protein
MGLSTFLNNFAGQLTNPTNALGQIGKAISQASGGPWGNALSILDQQHRQTQNDEYDQALKMAQLQALLAKQSRVQGVQLGEGGYGSFDPDTGELKVLREPTAKDDRPAIAKSFDWYSKLTPDQQKMARPFLPNYGLTQEGIAATVDRASGVAGVQGAARAQYRAPAAGRLSPYGCSKANPVPVTGPGDLSGLPKGTWVSPAPGVSFQVR